MSLNIAGFKTPFHSDLQGKSSKIYSFYSYSFETEISEKAKGQRSIFYVAEIENQSIIKRFNLEISDDIFKIKEEFQSLVPNIDNYSYLIYDGDEIIEDVIADIRNNEINSFSTL